MTTAKSLMCLRGPAPGLLTLTLVDDDDGYHFAHAPKEGMYGTLTELFGHRILAMGWEVAVEIDERYCLTALMVVDPEREG